MTNLERRAKSATVDGKASKKYNEYRNYDIQHGFDGSKTISPDEIKELCFSPDSKCEYCGCKVNLGADRIDNTKGHTKDNVICACRSCNIARGDNFTYADFKEITQKFKIKNTTFMTSRLCEVKSIDELLQLKFSSKNRAIDPKHVESIANHMIKNGYRIKDNTIFVDPITFVILRGQHRVSAAIDVYRRTGQLVPLEIVFKEMEGGEDDIADYIRSEESERKNWSIADFIGSYNGTPEYDKLMEFMNKNDIHDFKYLMHILKGISKGKLATCLDVSDIPTGQQIIDFIKKAYGENAFNRTNTESLVHVRNICTALRYFFELDTKTSSRKDTLKKVKLIDKYMASEGRTLFDYAPYFKKRIGKGMDDFMQKHDMKVPNADNIVEIISKAMVDMNDDLQKDEARAEEAKRKLSIRKTQIVAE